MRPDKDSPFCLTNLLKIFPYESDKQSVRDLYYWACDVIKERKRREALKKAIEEPRIAFLTCLRPQTLE